MIPENDPSSRMQILSIGQLRNPGTCYVCGSGNCDDGYLDFGTFVDYHGNFYLCLTCAKQAAETIGYFSPEEVALQQSSIERLTKENEELKAELENARPIVAAVSRLTSTVIAESGNVPSDSVSEGEREIYEPSDKPVSESTGGEPEPEEPVKGSGRKQSGGVKSRNLTL